MTTTETTPKPAKAPWVRCKGSGRGQSNGCKQRVFNDPIDIELHKQHCPADLERDLSLLEKRVEKLEKVEPVTIPDVPAIDEVDDDWPDADQPTTTGYQPPADRNSDLDDDEDWDDEDDDPNPPAPPIGASLYTPGTGPQ